MAYQELEEHVIVGLDIGTTKISCIICKQGENEQLEVIGVGIVSSKGLRKGVVINIDQTVKSIANAIGEAEIMAAVEPDNVITGIAGGHIAAENSKGVVAVTGKDRTISEEDIHRVIEQAKKITLPIEREILHVLPIEYIVDENDGIPDPLGMSGSRLEARVHIIHGNIGNAQNIIRSVEKAGYGIDDIVLQPLASAEAVLTDEERALGVGLVDIGGGTSDICVFFEGSVRHSHVIAIGGDHITSDIAIGLRTPIKVAEEIKISHGGAMIDLVNPDEALEIPGLEGRPSRMITRGDLCRIVQPRVEEMLELIKQQLHRSGYENTLGAGVVLTGGASQLKGIVELAERMLNLPVRIGYPHGVYGLSDQVKDPKFATGVGLVLYGYKNKRGLHRTRTVYGDGSDEHVFRNITKKMKGWIKDFF